MKVESGESSVAGTRSDVRDHTAEVTTRKAYEPSAVADARSKFEQVLQAASRQRTADAAAAAAAGSPLTDGKLSVTDTAVVTTPPCREPGNKLTPSLMYSQLVYSLLTIRFVSS